MAKTGPPKFMCDTEDGRAIASRISVLNFRKDATTDVTVIVSKEKMQFFVSKDRVLTARLDLIQDLFQHYCFTYDHLRFVVNLSVLSDCLSMFGSNNNKAQGFVHLSIEYDEDKAALQIKMTENDVVSICDVCTKDATEPLDLQFSSTSPTCKLSMQGVVLRDMLMELEHWGEIVELEVSASKASLSMLASGAHGSADITTQLPDNQPVNGFLNDLLCRYKHGLLKHMYPALVLCTDRPDSSIIFVFNEDGTLKVLFFITSTGNDIKSFLEYMILAQAEEDDQFDIDVAPNG